MKPVIFLGPTLPVATAAKELVAQYLPPVSQGDLYRAVENGARIIGIIDGHFEQVPAVWHKEILYAMSQGVHVFGAASMGALRAAELADFGMTGIGTCFEWFRDELLEDDDEVAIVHGPADVGYPVLSEAMVNIRATLDRAVQDTVIPAELKNGLIQAMKALHFSKRSYRAVVAAAQHLADADTVNRLRDWLSTGAVDLKRQDALDLLKEVAAFAAGDVRPKTVTYAFEHTDTWERMIRQANPPAGEELAPEHLLEELRLNPPVFEQISKLAMARALALRASRRGGSSDTGRSFDAVLNTYFLKRNLAAPDAIQAWMAAQELDTDGLTAFMKREHASESVRLETQNEIEAALPDVLRDLGQYGAIAARARQKARWLKDTGREAADPASTGLSDQELVAWFFKKRLQMDAPAHLDSLLRGLGLGSRQAFLQTLAREYHFVMSAAQS